MTTCNSTIVGYIQNYSIEHCNNWAKSIRVSGYEGNVVVIAIDVDAATVTWLKEFGFTVYEFAAIPDCAPVVLRFICLAKLIRERFITTDWVMMCDVRDVIFQKSAYTLDKYVFGMESEWTQFIGSLENVTYENEPWGRDNLLMSFPFMRQTMKDWPIINAGTFSARLYTMAGICETVFNMSYGNRVVNPDQAALNVLLHSGLIKYIGYGPVDYEYAIQCGTTLDPSKPLKQLNPIDWNPIRADGVVVNRGGTPYHIVHQYDRNPTLKALINAKYR